MRLLPDRNWPRVSAQVRTLVDRSALVLLAGVSIMLLLLSKADVKFLNFLSERLGLSLFASRSGR